MPPWVGIAFASLPRLRTPNSTSGDRDGALALWRKLVRSQRAPVREPGLPGRRNAMNIELNAGNTIPQSGFGVFQIRREDPVAAVHKALEVGYRHIDTAQGYGNEAEVGEAVRTSGLDRGEVFVTSKLRNGPHAPDAARAAFEGRLEALGLDHGARSLIPWPLPMVEDDCVETWRVFESFKREGRGHSIGVSNVQVAPLERLGEETESVPAVNQIAVPPYLLNAEVDAYGRDHG